ncbi:hypothetical protein [Kordia jejudonensis]|uniref:hypothetical protein n=1 Tax=Kordia jejudonensis TaxID=1348245 RepID=UPI0012E05992|nr:hypothetical protein [Kordia jejudonensis]
MSLFLFWLADVAIIVKYDVDTVSQWALLKSLIFISGSFISLGIDQAIVRLNLNYKETLLPVLFQIVVLTLLTCGILWIFDYDVSYPYVFLILLCYSTILILFSFERSKLNYTRSIFIFHFWRILFYVLIVSATYKLIEIPLAIAFISAIIFLVGPLRKISFKASSFKNYKPALKTGFYFFLSTCSLNVILFVDQLLINGLEDTTASEILFSHVTFFIAPFAAILSFLGFLLTPFLRDNKQKALLFLDKYLIHIVVGGVVMVFCYYLFSGWLYKSVKKQDPIAWLGIVLTFILYARYLLLIPSAYFGAFGENKLIRKVSIRYNLANIFYICAAFILLYKFGLSILVAISSALLITWSLRALIGYICLFELKRDTLRTKE